MAEDTKIQWARHTFNHVRGCTKVAPGCANCYADAQSKRNPGTLGVWGPNGTRVVAAESMWKKPLKWNEDAQADFDLLCAEGREYEHQRPRVFCASLADVFEIWDGPMVNSQGRELWAHPAGVCDGPWHSGQPNPEWRRLTMSDVRARLFALIDATPHLDWLLVTKRPENIRKMWVEGEYPNPSKNKWHRKNAWLLTSVSEQETADRNIPELLKCRDLSPVLGVSYEPALGPVDFTSYLGGQCPQHPDSSITRLRNSKDEPWSHYCDDCCDKTGGNNYPISGVDWMIGGGESGPNARPCNVGWLRSTVEQCRDAGVACFVKQLGANVQFISETANLGFRELHSVNLNDPKGGDPAEWPADLRVREFPR